MRHLLAALDGLGGLASRRELCASGVSKTEMDVAAYYALPGWTLLRVRKGWYARRAEHPEVIRAWRVGGRLTCVSASAYHDGVAVPPVLHVEVPARAAQLRDPDDEHRRLGPGAAVVVHWARYPGPGDRRAVTAAHAEAMAAVCGVHAGSVGRPAPPPQQSYAAASPSASRIV